MDNPTQENEFNAKEAQEERNALYWASCIIKNK